MSDETKAAGYGTGSAGAANDLAVDSAAKADAPFAAAANAAAPVRLRAAREALGFSLREVAARTRITSRYVEALEAGDYASLPGRPYALGFARGYARVVGLDESEIAEAVRRELESGTQRPEPRVFQQFEVGDPAKTPSRLVSWLALVLVIGIVTMGMVLWKSYYWPSTDLPSLVAREGQAPTATLSLDETTRRIPAAPQPTGPVVFTALESGVWVKFYDGAGTQLLQKQLAQGEAYTLPNGVKGPQLWTGRPDALAITIGGQAVPPLATQRMIMKDIAVDATSLLARSPPTNPDPVAVAATQAAAKANRSTLTRRLRSRVPKADRSSALPATPDPAVSGSSSTTAD